MVREKQNEFTRSEPKPTFRAVRAQAGPGVRRRSPQAGAGKRTGDQVPERRGCTINPHEIQQSAARCSRAVAKTGPVHGRKPLQVAALVLFSLLLAGCGAHRRDNANNVPPPPPPAPASTPAPRPTPEARTNPATSPAGNIPSKPRSTTSAPSGRVSSPSSEIIVPENAKVLYSEV